MHGLIMQMLTGTMELPPEVMEHFKQMLDAKEFAGIQMEEGQKMILPKGMPIERAIEFLTKKLEEEQAVCTIIETIDAFPFDAAHALSLVIHDLYGFSGNQSSTIATPFGNFSFAPKFIGVQIARGVTVQVPWGEFCLPGINGTFACGFEKKDNRVIFKLVATVQGKYRESVSKLVQALREKLKTHSIYKNKSLRVSFRDRNGEAIFFDPSVVPQFMDMEGDAEPIFTRSTEAQIKMAILDPIRHTDRLRKAGIKLRRTVLLEGDFGTGKTLTAKQTAKVCESNGWTFIYVTNCEDLDRALTMAEQYSPAVVFTEDVDRVMGGDRDEQADALSYTLDGVDVKNRETIVVLTTNDPRKIQKLMLRPGRIDSIISIQKPDADTTLRLMRLYAKGRMHGSTTEFEMSIAPNGRRERSFHRRSGEEGRARGRAAWRRSVGHHARRYQGRCGPDGKSRQADESHGRTGRIRRAAD